ncbi:MAG TPA: GNAT family N-acetyltransferase [Methylomirabilota bacterium]|nr:GNAT family N-acetyltransferase [Methylomirabilota bacterium]
MGQDREQGLAARLATAADAAAIAALVRLAFSTQSRPTDPPPGALRETPGSIAHELARGGGAVVERAGALVGAVLWVEEDRSLHVGRLSVHPAHRRRGIARRLMDEAEREARRRGLARLHLGVRLVLEDNRRLFAACGFVETTRHAHEGFSEPTWVRMERRLDG